MTPEEAEQFVNRLKAKLWQQPKKKWFSIIAKETRNLPPNDRGVVETLMVFGFQAGEETVNKSSWEQRWKDCESWVVWASGALFILFVLVFAIAIPDPTPSQMRILRPMLALAISGLSTPITGFLAVQMKYSKRGRIQATGALAVFVLVYCFF